jgi:hypothetical protein
MSKGTRIRPNVFRQPREWALAGRFGSRWLGWPGPLLAVAIVLLAWSHPIRQMHVVERVSFFLLVFAGCVYQPWLLLRALRAVLPEVRRE